MQPELLMKTELIQTAIGERPADLYIENGRLVNVYSGEILESYNLAVCNRHIAYAGPSRKMISSETRIIDAEGAYLVPGYIDPHAHVDFWANPVAMTPYLLLGGTTTVMADPHDIVGAVGLPGLDLLLQMTQGLPLKFFFSLPVTSPPYPQFEGKDVVSLEDMERFLTKERILALSEITPWVRLIEADKAVLDKFEQGERMGKNIEGHTAGASPAKLNALVASGLTSCHEAINANEARERLRLGLAVMLRHGSIRSDLKELIGLVTRNPELSTHRVMFTPDWSSPGDILENGYMDHLVRFAIELGVPPVTAVQMATVNPATYLHLDKEFGGLAPGRRADILLVDDMREPTPRTVIADGRVVVENHKCTYEPPALLDSALKVPWLARRVIPDDIGPEDFMVKAVGLNGMVTLPAIEIVDKTITRRCDLSLPLTEGRVGLPNDQDVLKASVMNKTDDGFMTAFLSGFGAKVGGLASSISHEMHKPLVIGCRETDMVAALQHQKKMGGGVVLVDRGEILAEIPLPIGGLMSVASLKQVADQMDRMKAIVKGMGSPLEDPVFTLGFLGFSALPWIRLTPSGLLDVKNLKIVYP